MKSTVARTSLGFRILCVLALALFAVYLAWNVAWLVQGRLAPSLLTAIGIPGPTTGLTRSLIALSEGDWRASLHWHPFSVPLVLLIVFSVSRLLREIAHRRRPLLSRGTATVWLVLLAVSWLAKFVIGPESW